MLQDSQTPDVVQSLLGTTFFDKEAAIGKRIGDPQISDKSIDPLQAFVNKGPSLKGTLGNLVSGAQDQFGRTFDMIDEKFPGVLGDLDANARNLVSDPVGQTSAAIEAGANLTDFKVDPITKKAQEANDEADAASKNAQKAQLDAASADIAQQSKVSMAQAGATKEELSAWDKFSSEYDLATIGMALMASNDGSSTFSSNFGKALMAGKQAKMSAKDKATAAATAGRKEARDERDITVKEANAYTARMKAMADGAGVKWEDSTTTSSAYVVQGFKKAGIDAGEIEDGLTIEERNKVIGAAINTRLKSNPPSSTSERDAVIDQAVADYMSQFHNTAMFFGEDWERIAGG